MGLTDKAIEILLGALLLGLLLLVVDQELVLRHANLTVTRRLNLELECAVGSTCAQKLSDEAARGAALVVTARAAAAAEAAAAQAARDEQAADAARQLQATADQAQKAANNWKAKYAAALKTPDCATWAKQVNQCVIH